jgi:hypothetical protein
MVPALPAAECVLACNIRKLTSPASGPPAQHSTALRAAHVYFIIVVRIENTISV